MNVSAVFALNRNTYWIDLIDSQAFWRFLENLVEEEGGLAKLEQAIFDPAHAGYDSTYIAVKFCAEHANDGSYHAILERVLREHSGVNERMVAARTMYETGAYEVLESAYGTEEAEDALREIAKGLVMRDVLATVPDEQRAKEAVNMMFTRLWDWGDESTDWVLKDNLNSAAIALGFREMLDIIVTMITHDRTPEATSRMICRQVREHAGVRIADSVARMLAGWLADSIMGGKKTVGRKAVERAVNKHFARLA